MVEVVNLSNCTHIYVIPIASSTVVYTYDTTKFAGEMSRRCAVASMSLQNQANTLQEIW